MRFVIIFFMVIAYLFSLVYIESELVRYRLRRESLRNQRQELIRRQQDLDSRLMLISNLAVIEEKARERNFVFPGPADILGVIR